MLAEEQRPAGLADVVALTARSVADAEPHRAAWDRLAAQLGRPFSSPAWMLGWFEHCRPRGARARIVFVYHHSDMVGVAPFYTSVGALGLPRHRMLGSGTGTRLEPLAAPGAEDVVAHATCRALAAGSPRPRMVSLDGIPADSAWPALLQKHWGGTRPPMVITTRRSRAPFVGVTGGGFDEWFRTRSSRYRRRVRAACTEVRRDGGAHRSLRAGEIDDGCAALISLHMGRWAARGGSRTMTPGMRRLVTSVAGDLAPAGRFVLFVVTRGEQIVAANALLGAGNELAGWLFGFDERSERLSPFHVTITDAVRHAAARGISRIDLGHGGQAYKGRVATGEETLVWVSLVEPGPGHLMRRASLLPELYREDVSRAVPERIRPQVWRMLNLLARFRRG